MQNTNDREVVDEISQEFKEINIYIDDIYDYYIRNNGKDAGNLWIQFSDKLRHLEQKIKAQSQNQALPLTDDELDFVSSALNSHWHEAYDNLQREDLGIIERINYQHQLEMSKELMTKIEHKANRGSGFTLEDMRNCFAAGMKWGDENDKDCIDFSEHIASLK